MATVTDILDRLVASLGGGGFNDWHVGVGARLPAGAVAALVAAAVAALLLSAVTLIRDPRPRRLLVFVLRTAAIAACLLVALQPVVQLRQIVRVPNRVAVLVDASRSMEVRPPDGGPSRAERAAALLERAAPRLGGGEGGRPHGGP